MEGVDMSDYLNDINTFRIKYHDLFATCCNGSNMRHKFIERYENIFYKRGFQFSKPS